MNNKTVFCKPNMPFLYLFLILYSTANYAAAPSDDPEGKTLFRNVGVITLTTLSLGILGLLTVTEILNSIPNNQNDPLPFNSTIGCYSLTTQNCGTCNATLGASVRCIANDASALAQAKNQLTQQLTPICSPNSNFTFNLEQQPCMAGSQTKCFNDQFAAQISFLNQTCRAEPKSVHAKTVKRLMKKQKNSRKFQQSYR